MRRAILVLSASVLITSFMPASAATGSALDPVPIPGVGSLLELEVSSGFVFVGDQNGTTIVVFDHQLNLVGTLTGLVSLQDLMIKDDVMYVTSHGADRIDVFDLRARSRSCTPRSRRPHSSTRIRLPGPAGSCG